MMEKLENKKGKKGVMSDFTLWMIIAAAVIVVAVVIIIMMNVKGGGALSTALNSIKNFFSFGGR